MAKSSEPVNFVDELDTSRVGAFEAERIDNLKDGQFKKMIHCVGVYSKGWTFPEQGTYHLERKKAIMKEHPEVKQLYGQHPPTAIMLTVVWFAHLYYSYYFSQYSWPVLVIGAYSVGAWLGFVLQIGGHDATHRLIFKSAAGNKAVALFVFLPVFLGPFGMIWMYEHMWHHNVVVDKCVRYGPQSNPPLRKAFLTLIFFFIVNIVIAVGSLALGATMLVTIPLGLLGLRKSLYPAKFPMNPYDRFPQCINGWMAANILICIVYNVALVYFLGWKALIYQGLSACFLNGLHPLGMRQVQEHYFIQKGQPTNSVYSFFNAFLLNVGYHVEHHDFAAVPWQRLPALRNLAPEYYLNLKHYQSYTQVLYEFLTNPGIPLDTLFSDDDHKN